MPVLLNVMPVFAGLYQVLFTFFISVARYDILYKAMKCKCISELFKATQVCVPCERS